MSKANPWKTTSSKITYKNPWIKVREDAVITPMGTNGIYGVVESKDSVIIVALSKQKEIYLINGYSYPSESWGWKLPGGGGEDEKALIASQRELAEETGITATEWNLLGKTIVCNGLLSEKMTTYLAQDLTIGEKLHADDNNLIDGGKFFSIEQLHVMIDDATINDGQTITGLYLAERWLASHKPSGSYRTST